MNEKTIKEEMARNAQKALVIIEKAEAAGRPLDGKEAREVRGILSRQDDLEEALKTHQRVREVGSKIGVPGASPDGVVWNDPNAVRHGSVGEKIAEAFRTKADSGRQARWSTGVLDFEVKALLDSTTAPIAQPDVQPGILPELSQRLTVANLMAGSSTSSNLVRVMVETLATNAAAGVAEGDPKPESALEFDAVDEAVKKIATFLPVVDEVLEDVRGLGPYINSRLRLFVLQEEERQLLHGAGGAELEGLLGRIPLGNQGITSAAIGATGIDHLRAGMATVRNAFLEPDGIVIHPADYEAIISLKDEAGRYLSGDPFSGDAGRRLYGLNLAITTAATAGEAIVGAFKQASTIYRKGGVSVEMSNSHASFFQDNKTAIRAEERLALAVSRPEAFATVDLSA